MMLDLSRRALRNVDNSIAIDISVRVVQWISQSLAVGACDLDHVEVVE